MTKILLNQEVPDFSFQASNTEVKQFAELRNKVVILYFYPKDDTPGCTCEAEDFREAYPNLTENIILLGVSRDSLKSHEKFIKKFNLPFALISDEDESICTLFDVIKMKNMYGKQVRGIERSTFLIDKNGLLKNEWRKVKVENHVQEVLTAAQRLAGTNQ